MTDTPDREFSVGRRWLAAGIVLLLLLAGFGQAPDGARSAKPGDAQLALALVDPFDAVLPEAQLRAPASHPGVESPEDFPDAALHDECRVGALASPGPCLHVPLWLSNQPQGLAWPRAPPAS